jgi:hypothetical protein
MIVMVFAWSLPPSHKSENCVLQNFTKISGMVDRAIEWNSGRGDRGSAIMGQAHFSAGSSTYSANSARLSALGDFISTLLTSGRNQG